VKVELHALLITIRQEQVTFTLRPLYPWGQSSR